MHQHAARQRFVAEVSTQVQNLGIRPPAVVTVEYLARVARYKGTTVEEIIANAEAATERALRSLDQLADGNL